MRNKQPTLSPPEPLRGAELGTFTHHSVVNRLPEIGRRTLAGSWFPTSVASNVDDLIESIPDGPIRHLLDSEAPDGELWRSYVEPFEGQDWLAVPWFFAETYFYRRLMEATGYFGEIKGRSYGYGFDPFFLQKLKGFEANLESSRGLMERLALALKRSTPDKQTFGQLLQTGLWSNQADLSLWPVGSQEDPAHGDGDAGHSYILVDQRQEVVDNLFGRQLPAPRVDFLIDNAGFELVVDLATALYLLAAGMAEEVVLHVKAHPTFVSDAISADVRKTVDLLAAEENSAAATAGSRLEKYLASHKLRIETDFFWTSPLAMWQMPDALREDLSKSAVIISKGDANYRRLLGDRHWPFETPFENIVSYMPTPVLALRALKSEVACGLRPSQAETTAKKDPEWLTDGRWGVIQFRG